MVLSIGGKVLRGWLVVNSVLDLLPLGLIPVLLGAPGAKLLQDMSTTPLAEPNDYLPLRLAAWGFFKDFGPRFAAGYMAFTAGGVPLAVDLLCIFSYASEVFIWAGEIFMFKTTTLKAAGGNLLVPSVCIAAIAASYL